MQVGLACAISSACFGLLPHYYGKGNVCSSPSSYGKSKQTLLLLLCTVGEAGWDMAYHQVPSPPLFRSPIPGNGLHLASCHPGIYPPPCALPLPLPQSTHLAKNSECNSPLSPFPQWNWELSQLWHRRVLQQFGNTLRLAQGTCAGWRGLTCALSTAVPKM